jgi:hypothetical protein
MSRPPSRFRAPNWLWCVACMIGVVPVIASLTAALVTANVYSWGCFVASIGLFRYSIQLLTTGKPPGP